MSIKDVLRLPKLYRALTWLVGGPPARRRQVRDYIRPFSGCSVLDIGCGPADLLAYLPDDIHYVGVDYEESYIKAAQARYGKKGTFICRSVDAIVAESLGKFDIVLAIGLLHHLDDDQCRHLLSVAKDVLHPEGRLITLDGCFRSGQSPIARWMLKNDRGEYVREESGYLSLAQSVFPHVEATVHDDFLRIPYTLNIMTLSKSKVASHADNSALVGAIN